MNQGTKDHAGILLSCICGVHCVIAPFLAGANFLFAPNPIAHAILLPLAIILSGWTIIHALKTHCLHIVVFFGVVGIGLLSLDVIIHMVPDSGAVHGHQGHDHAGHNHQPVHIDDYKKGVEIELLPLLAGIALLAHHALNMFYSRRIHKCGDC